MGAGEIERLKQLLKRPENKTCADCNTKQPRWASINLGCFICIRCSGIHRSIGVHISKVRSVTLDDWQSAWVDNMERWGNKKVNQLYESKLGSNRKPDGTVSDRDLEHFIRQKYEHKAFMAKDLGKKSQTEKVSSEESESEEESGSGSDESDTSEDEEVLAPPKSRVDSKATKPQGSRPLRPKATKTHGDLTREFEKVAVSSGNEAFAEFSQAPAPKPASSSSSATNPRNNASSHNSNDFGQFSDFFSAESKPMNTVAASNDKDFIMSLFQSAPAAANQPDAAATAFVSGPISSGGPYMQTPSNLPYSQGASHQMPYSGQQGMPGMPSAASAASPPIFHNNIPMASYPAAPPSYGMPHGLGPVPPEMMPAYPQQMMNPIYGQQQASPSSIPYGQMPQQAQWPQQNPYQ